mmetsp:Transcript_6264/g.8189  ORF Transcript_6264/g.8189 Transcript_6264/m.8189 type:complete len:173 (+) Transcript_6264:106-624(+)
MLQKVIHLASTTAVHRTQGICTSQTKCFASLVKATLFHNPKCARSRTTLKLLSNCGPSIAERNGYELEIEVREYLENPLSVEELKNLQRKLSLPPFEWTRKIPSKVYNISGISEGSEDNFILEALSENPILMQRPICLIEGDTIFHTACIGRPPNKILEVLSEELGTTHCGQ